MRDPLFDALLRTGLMRDAFIYARAEAKRRGEHDKARQFGMMGDQVFDSQASR